MKNEYVKVWVWDEALERVQTSFVLYGTMIPRWYGRDPVYRYAHDLFWDTEARLAESANDFFDFYYFSGNPQHLDRMYWMERLTTHVKEHPNTLRSEFLEENYNVELSLENPGFIYPLRGIKVK